MTLSRTSRCTPTPRAACTRCGARALDSPLATHSARLTFGPRRAQQQDEALPADRGDVHRQLRRAGGGQRPGRAHGRDVCMLRAPRAVFAPAQL
eukprot:4400737-Prymnesium_polylepis.1